VTIIAFRHRGGISVRAYLFTGELLPQEWRQAHSQQQVASRTAIV